MNFVMAQRQSPFSFRLPCLWVGLTENGEEQENALTLGRLRGLRKTGRPHPPGVCWTQPG